MSVSADANNNSGDDVASPIQKFYANKSILVTGATGFIGKVLIEKLLYSCPDIEKIYLLIRGSKGKNAKERMVDMVSKQPFNMRLKTDFCLTKLVAIDSDLAEENLALSEEDRQTLIKNVHLVFHVAASVKFEAPLEVNIKHNVVATRSLLDIATKFERLQCFVHVSTAYSNCQLRQIDERVYPMEVADDLTNLKVSKEMLDNRPNTYTYTKAMAENVATKYASKMNIVIVRPSIVMSSLKEPAEGWVDTINGPVGLSILGALGLLQKIKVNSEVVFDLIPADTVSNALVAIGWANTERRDEFLPGSSPSLATPVKQRPTNQLAIKKQPQNIDSTVRVFNLTTGSENPCSFYHYFSTGRDEAYRVPSTRVLRPLLDIPKQKGMNAINYWIYKVFSHILFAHLIDLILNLTGQKKMCIKAVSRMHHANDVFDYFCSNQWTFVTDNVKRLRDLQTPRDRQTFNFDVRQLDWSAYARLGWLGCRRFILKEDEKSIEYARKRYRRICILYYLFKALALLAVTLVCLACYQDYPLISFVITPIYPVIYLL